MCTCLKTHYVNWRVASSNLKMSFREYLCKPICIQVFFIRRTRMEEFVSGICCDEYMCMDNWNDPDLVLIVAWCRGNMETRALSDIRYLVSDTEVRLRVASRLQSVVSLNAVHDKNLIHFQIVASKTVVRTVFAFLENTLNWIRQNEWLKFISLCPFGHFG